MHWCRRLGGSREGAGWHWRAPCPADQTPRSLEWTIKGKSIWWNSFCPHHDKDALRPVLRQMLGTCLPGRARNPAPVIHGDLASLALSGLQPQALKIRLLEMTGMSTEAAMDKLGIERANRYRLRHQLCQFDHKPAGQ